MEIFILDVVCFYYYLNLIVNEFLLIEKDVNIELLIGRDVLEVYYVFY